MFDLNPIWPPTKWWPSRSPYLMTSPRPKKVTYGCYPSIPHALRFTKGAKGLMAHPVYFISTFHVYGNNKNPTIRSYLKQLFRRFQTLAILLLWPGLKQPEILCISTTVIWEYTRDHIYFSKSIQSYTILTQSFKVCTYLCRTLQ
jgi:hypothetical protein